MFDFIKKEARTLMLLAFPVIIAQASQSAIVFVDTIMSGHFSATDLAGIAIGTSIWLPTILFGHGLLAILTPIIAHLNGGGERQKIANQTRQGVILALFISLFIMFILYNSDKIFALKNWLGVFITAILSNDYSTLFAFTFSDQIDSKMMLISVNFLRCIMWGVPGYLLFQVFRNQCEGLSNTKPAMVIGFLALLINIPINYIFIYGKLGLPAMGGVGCGITAAIIYWLMFFSIFAYVKTAKNQRDIKKAPVTQFVDWFAIKRIFSLGLPIALAYFFEVSLFAVVSLLIAPLGETAVASHQIVFAISSMSFVIPLSLSVATSIRVSYLLGEKLPKYAKQSAYTSLTIAFLLSVIVAIILLVFGRFFISIFTSEDIIIDTAMTLIHLLAIYQCSDYVQVIAASILRGYKDTKIIFVITFIAYWLVGLPIGYVLGLTNFIVPALGAAGFWIGFIFGLTLAAILLFSRIIWLQKQSEDKILIKAA